MLPAPFAYPLSVLPACFHSLTPLNQMTAMIYRLKSLPHSDSPPKKIHPVTIKCNILFKSTLHFIELYCILSHPAYLCKTPGDLTFTLLLGRKLPSPYLYTRLDMEVRAI